MLILALDPNICLAASLGHTPSERLLEDIMEHKHKNYVRIGIDEKDTILEAYEDLMPQVHEPTQKILQDVLKNQDDYIKKVSISAKLNEEQEFLQHKQCGTPVEPELITLCLNEDIDVQLFFVVGPSFKADELSFRGVHNPEIVSALEDYYPDFKEKVWDAVDARQVLADCVKNKLPYPFNERQLKEYLKRHNYEESTSLEFKQPENNKSYSGRYLNRNTLIKAIKEICGMANTEGGKVLIGIKELETQKGEIEGFKPLYKGTTNTKPKTNDQLCRILYDEYDEKHKALLKKVDPPFGADEFKVAVIDLSNGRKVLVMQVEKCKQEHWYGNSLFCREGSSNKLKETRK